MFSSVKYQSVLHGKFLPMKLTKPINLLLSNKYYNKYWELMQTFPISDTANIIPSISLTRPVCALT